MNLPMLPLPIEKTVDNEWFLAQFVRQDGVKLFAHIKYKKWSATAKKKTKELMDTFDEPLYAFIHDLTHYKFVSSLGFTPTGDLIHSYFPGKENQAFNEVVYYKDGLEKYSLALYKEVGDLAIPFEAVDGYGKIEEIEKKLSEMDQVKWETKHYFSDGVYTRETFIPSGTTLTGYRHKHTTISMLLKGAISVLAVDKSGRATNFGVLSAPDIIVTKPFMKKIGFAHEDVIFVNSFSISEIPVEFHNEEHIDIIEDYIFEKDQICLE